MYRFLRSGCRSCNVHSSGIENTAALHRIAVLKGIRSVWTALLKVFFGTKNHSEWQSSPSTIGSAMSEFRSQQTPDVTQTKKKLFKAFSTIRMNEGIAANYQRAPLGKIKVGLAGGFKSVGMKVATWVSVKPLAHRTWTKSLGRPALRPVTKWSGKKWEKRRHIFWKAFRSQTTEPDTWMFRLLWRTSSSISLPMSSNSNIRRSWYKSQRRHGVS